MSYVLAAILVFLGVVVGIPAVTLGLALLLGGRPRWLERPRRGARRPTEPGIQAYLMLVVLVVLALALLLLVPWVAAFAGLPAGFTAVEGAFLAVLALLGLGYAWRRG